jgi:polysaccharide pyruvyl transferase
VIARPRRVALLSTYYENAGDDLIRHGVQHQLGAVLDLEPHWRHVSKSNLLSMSLPLSQWTHAPVSRMPARQKRLTTTLSRALRGARFLPDKFRGADVFAVAGTPIFYFVGDHSFIDVEAEHGANWPEAILAERIEQRRTPRMVALGIGSIYEGSPVELLARHPTAASFIRRFVERAGLVTTRDAATDALLRTACPEHDERIVRSICPSFWAQERFGVAPAPKPKHVLVSFAVESAAWDLSAPRADVVAGRLRALDWVLAYFRERRYDVALVAHNRYDLEPPTAIAHAWGLPAPMLVDARGLVEATWGAQAVVTWRVHGALAAVAAGRPALLFRTDSRWGTAAELGAGVLDDRCLSRPELVGALDRLCAQDAPQLAAARAAADARRSRELERLRVPLLKALGRSAAEPVSV